MKEIYPFAGQVRAHSRDRYLATLFAPEGKRRDLFVLHAFDAEIRRIAAVVKEPGMGEIRLQWWREILEGKRDGEAAGHPLATAILDVSRRHSLPASAFDSYLEAASFAFYHDTFADRFSFEAWAGAFHSSVIQVAAIILDPVAAAASADASGHAGVALAVAEALRDLPQARSKGYCRIPENILGACGHEMESFVTGRDKSADKRVTDAFAAFGQEHCARAKAALQSIPAVLKPAYLRLGLAERIFRIALKPAARPASQPIVISALGTHVSILRAALR